MKKVKPRKIHIEKSSKLSNEDLPIGKLTKVDLKIPRKPNFRDSPKIKLPKSYVKKSIKKSRIVSKSSNLSLGEMLIAAMGEAVQIAENPNEFPKKFRVVKDSLPAPKELLKSPSAKPRKNNKKKFKR